MNFVSTSVYASVTVLMMSGFKGQALRTAIFDVIPIAKDLQAIKVY